MHRAPAQSLTCGTGTVMSALSLCLCTTRTKPLKHSCARRYDWPNGRNLNQIASQLGVRDVLYDVEYDNHTSEAQARTCVSVDPSMLGLC